MKRLLFICIALAVSSFCFGALSGVKFIPGTTGDPNSYATIALAFADLNAQGVGPGGVIFNIAGNYTEAIITPLLITATGTAADPVIFRMDPWSSGNHPMVIRTDAGTIATSTLGGQGDAVIILQGCDYITFDAIDVTAQNQGIEYGYYLRKASVTDGCKFVAIKNAAITMTKGTSGYVAGIYSSNNDAVSLVSSATGITITSIGGRNENVTLTGNTISNVFAGILLRGYNHSISPYDFHDQNNVVGAIGVPNVIQNYAGNSSSASYGVYLIYQTSPNVSYNQINNAGGGGGNATSTLYGIFMSTSNAGGDMVFNNNNITLGQGSTSLANCIHVAPKGNSATIDGNTFSYGQFNSTTASYMIYCSNATNDITVDGNQTAGTITKSGVGPFDAYYNFGSPTGGTAVINNNNFSNIVLTGASTFYGIRQYTAVAQVEIVSNNTISNITSGTSPAYGIYHGYGAAGSAVSGNQVINWTGAGAMYGIYLGASTAPVSLAAYENFVNGITTTGTSVYGIINNLGTENSIYKNKICNLVCNSAGGVVYGIYLIAGATTHVYNNFISSLNTPVSNAAVPLVGIYLSGGTNANIFYNSVLLNASSSGALFGSAALYASVVPNLDLRNNILVNKSVPNGATGYTAAYRRSGVNLATYSPNSNSNNYFAGMPGPHNLIFYDGTSAVQTIAAYKLLVGPVRDAASFSEDPPFMSSGCDLHILTTVPTMCESGGIQITSPIPITDDIDGNPRAATPDVGADEFNGIPIDIFPPTIVYTPLSNTNSSSGRLLVATVSDPGGVPVTPPGWPMLYWKINGAASYTAVTPVYMGSNQFQFTFGGGVTTGDVVYYYIVAQDMNVTPNVGSYPSAGASGFSSDPPSASIPPSNPSSYVITAAPLSGDYLVGPGMSYPTITAAVADLNLLGVNGPVRFLLLDASYSTAETYPIVVKVMNANLPTSSNTVTLKPASGVNSAITGVSASSQIFSIRNDYFIVDGSNTIGGTTRDLSIINTSATSPQVVGISSSGTVPVVGVCVKNCNIINGSAAGSAIVTSAVDGSAGYFNNITIQNNSIQKAYIGIYNIAVATPGNGNGLLVTSNDLNATGTNAIRLTGVYVQGFDGATVTGNNIGNIANSTDASNIAGIWFSTGTVNSTITGNTISTISGSLGAPRGIAISPAVANANINISGNTITGITSAYSSATYGIYISGSTSAIIVQKNKISNIKNTHTSGYSAIGLGLASTQSSANITVKNNFIWDIAGYGWSSYTTDNGYGINISSGGGYSIIFNSISLSTDQILGTGIPACLIIGSSVPVGGLDIRNNIFSIDALVGTNRYAVICNAPASVFSSIDYNDYVSSGPNLFYLGANISNLPAWQIVTGQDIHSISGNPMFMSAGNLHILPGVYSPVRNAGVFIASVPDDIDGNLRANPPYIGAAEGGNIQMTLTGTVTNTSCFGAANGEISLAVSGGFAPYTYAWSNGATTAGLTGLAAGTYTVTVTDAAMFTATGSWTVSAPTAITLNAVTNPVSCQGMTNGSVNLTATGGTAPYTYGWITGATTEDLVSLAPGNYSVTVTDMESCTQTGSWTVTEPLAIALDAVTNPVSCQGMNNGSINLTITGGTAPYTYFWIGGATTEDLESLAPGNYSVTVTDMESCTQTGSWTVSEPAAIALNAVAIPPGCQGMNNGSINLTITGGTAPYTYGWITGATTEDLVSLAPGDYSVSVTDMESCTQTGLWTVGQGPVCPVLNVGEVVSGTLCYSATQIIYVSGPPPTIFQVLNGGHATMIAGQKILYYSGTQVFSGGYMHGFIAPAGPWCGEKAASIIAVPEGITEIVPVKEKSFFTIYPNPTTGGFSLELKGVVESAELSVEIYGLRGEHLLSAKLYGMNKYDFSLAGKPNGVYIMRIITGKYVETHKIIKQ